MGHVPKPEAERPGQPEPPTDSPRHSGAEEAELVRRAQAGEVAAFEEIVRRHQKRVLAIVAGVLSRKEDVEDVGQQVFVKVFLSLKRFDARSKFSTWLYKVTINECWDYLRKKRARPLVYEADLGEEQLEQLETVRGGELNPRTALDAERRAEIRDTLDRLLGELSPEERLMMLLKEVEGFSLEEIGEMLDVNVNTAKVRLFRARRRLMDVHRRKLSGKGRTTPAHKPKR